MFTVDQIEAAHQKVKSGADFPNYIQELKKMAVSGFETWVSDSHTLYFGKDNFQAISKPQYAKLHIESATQREKFMSYLHLHQQGDSNYLTFCKQCAETGIEKWVVDLHDMTCIYYNQEGQEILTEKIPQ